MTPMWETIKRGYMERYRSSPVMVMFLTAMVAMAFVFLLTAVVTGGRTALEMMLPDSTETFMDHFKSIMYSIDDPYSKWSVIYPPFITAVYAILGNYIVPFTTVAEGEELAYAMRDSIMGAMTFLFIVLGTLYILHLATNRILKEEHTAIRVELTFILIATSFPMVYAIQRGNCVVMTVVLCLIFLLRYRSENKIARYLSFVALGAAAGMKLYPALFAVLLIRERRWNDVLACLLIGVAMMFLPLLITGGAPFAFIENALSYSDSSAAGGGNITINDWIYALLGHSDSTRFISLIAQGAIALLTVFVTVFCKEMKNWKLVALISCNLALVFGIGTGYIVIYAIIPSLFFLKEERTLGTENLFFLACFVVCLCLTPGDLALWSIIPSVKAFMLLLMLGYLLMEGIVKIVRPESRGLNPLMGETNM